jgi:predicted RNA binding protein YcfA (HicA-like mRNA interferase family)
VGKKDKVLQKIINNPKNVLFAIIKKILTDNGYSCINTGGSHYVFRKNNNPSITIPMHKPIKIIYVKQVIKILEQNND